MLRSIILNISSALILLTQCVDAQIYSQSVEFGVGWRRDDLNWKVHDSGEHYTPSCCSDSCSCNSSSSSSSSCSCNSDSSNSHSFDFPSSLSSKDSKDHVHSDLHFKDIDLFTCNGRARFIGCGYYIRLKAEYGISDKGRLDGHRRIYDLFSDPLYVQISRPIKRRSEVYDFSGAIGCPLNFCCHRLQTIPLVGFSFHRQQLWVKHNHHLYFDSSQGYFIDAGSFDSCSSSSSSCSAWQKRASRFRFSWYGFFAGLDVAFALDPCWSLRGEFEYHYGRCHRKEKACLDFGLIDKYRHTDYSHGFNGTVGATWNFCPDWYFGFYIDTKWWKSDDKKDKLYWSSVGANATVGYLF